MFHTVKTKPVLFRNHAWRQWQERVYQGDLDTKEKATAKIRSGWAGRRLVLEKKATYNYPQFDVSGVRVAAQETEDAIIVVTVLGDLRRVKWSVKGFLKTLANF